LIRVDPCSSVACVDPRLRQTKGAVADVARIQSLRWNPRKRFPGSGLWFSAAFPQPRDPGQSGV